MVLPASLRKFAAGLAAVSPVRVRSRTGWGRAAVAYLPRPLREPDETVYMKRHQNRREAREIVKILVELGLDVDVGFCRGPLLLRRTDYDVVLGVEPNFVRLAVRNPCASKVYYATGTYCRFQRTAEERRIAELNQERHSRLRITRRAMIHEGAEIADLIVQIGTSRTVQTYPDHLRSKVRLVRPSVLGGDASPIRRDWETARRTFLWLGGKGPILKGLDLCLAAFAARPNLCLLIAGEWNRAFASEFAAELSGGAGIEALGWLEVGSENARQVAQQAGFILLPSASEGFAGSVLTGMAYGLIPVTSWIASPPVGVPSIEVRDLTISGVQRAIDEASAMTPGELAARSSQCLEYVSREHTLNTFRADLARSLAGLISRRL